MKLKYKKIILFITMFTMCIGLVTLFIGGSSKSEKQKKDNSKKTGDVADSNKQSPASTQSTTENPSNSEAKQDDEFTLEWNAYPEINQLVEKYFSANLKDDTENLTKLVTNTSNINDEKLKSKYNLIESFSNVDCYTIKEPDTQNYLVYVSVDWKLKDVDTLVPGLDFLYISQAEDGSFLVYNGEINSNTQKFIRLADESEGVLNLIQSTNLKYEESVTKDQKLQELEAKIDDNSEKVKKDTQESSSPGNNINSSAASSEESGLEEHPE